MSDKILVVEARFYDEIADNLFNGAEAVLSENGIAHDRVSVPGSYEIPAAIAMAIDSLKNDYKGFLVLGCVIRGETSHYDHICDSVSQSLQDIVVAHKVPLGFGMLTCESREQATVRADVSGKNYGGNAAKALVAMMKIKETI